MENRKPDRRILKTKKAIHNAYAELLKYKDSNDISIKDIADTADISRKTFYSYYDGIWQIEDEIENEIIQTLSNEIYTLNIEEIIKNPYLIFQKLTEIINTDLDFYGNLIVNNRHSKLLYKISSMLEEELRKSLLETLKLEKSTVNLVSKYIINGLIAVFEDWFKSDRKISLEQISRDLSDVIFSVLVNFKNKNN